jgi:hypothetical protein
MAGTEARIHEIREAGAEREGKNPSFFFFLADKAIDAYRFRGFETLDEGAGNDAVYDNYYSCNHFLNFLEAIII